MSRRSVAPIDYDSSALATLTICKRYLEEAIGYLQDKRKALPNAAPLTSARFPASSIITANAVEAAANLRWPTIEAVIEDREAPGERRSSRYFDPWYFLVMLLMEIPGGRFRFDRSKNSEYFYLAYAGPSGREGNFYLRRVIVDTPSWADTREGKHRKDAHYDYRRPTLKRVYKPLVRALDQKTRGESRKRPEAVQFAVDLFTRQLTAHLGESGSLDGVSLPGLDMTAA